MTESDELEARAIQAEANFREMRTRADRFREQMEAQAAVIAEAVRRLQPPWDGDKEQGLYYLLTTGRPVRRIEHGDDVRSTSHGVVAIREGERDE